MVFHGPAFPAGPVHEHATFRASLDRYPRRFPGEDERVRLAWMDRTRRFGGASWDAPLSRRCRRLSAPGRSSRASRSRLRNFWWRIADSNRASPGCKPGVLSTEPIPRNLAGTAGLEPASCRLTGGRSAVELHAIWWIGKESNLRRAGLQPTALPSELPIRKVSGAGARAHRRCCGRLVLYEDEALPRHFTQSTLSKNTHRGIKKPRWFRTDQGFLG